MTEDNPTDPASPTERARIEPSAPPKRLDALPVLYLVGFLILGAALIYLWRNPSMPRGAAQEAARVDTLRAEVEARKNETAALAARLTQLEARPAPATPDLGPLDARLKSVEARPAPPPAVDLAPLAARTAALEGRAPTDVAPLETRLKALEDRAPPPQLDLAPLEARVKAVEDKPPPPPVDLGPLAARVKAVEDKPPPPKVDLGPVEARVAALEGRIGVAETQGKASAAALAGIADKAQRSQRLISATAALEAGQRLGDIAGAPPAVAKFALDAPPTESALRLSFNQAAEAAHRASQPGTSADKPLLDRMWSRAQQSVTVRQGDQVLVGDPASGVLARARIALDAGDLAGAVKALAALDAPAKAAMADWIGRAQSLLDARAALAEMAARS